VGVKNFIGRDTELEQITSHFATPRIHGPLILVLHAMGGQGKSQLALEYCRSSRQKRVYRAIFWIQAHDEGLTTRSFHDVAVELGLKTPGDLLEPRLLLSLVKQALEVYEGRWLLVFDNYDQPQQFKNIKDYFPEGNARCFVVCPLLMLYSNEWRYLDHFQITWSRPAWNTDGIAQSRCG